MSLILRNGITLTSEKNALAMGRRWAEETRSLPIGDPVYIDPDTVRRIWTEGDIWLTAHQLKLVGTCGTLWGDQDCPRRYCIGCPVEGHVKILSTEPPVDWFAVPGFDDAQDGLFVSYDYNGRPTWGIGTDAHHVRHSYTSEYHAVTAWWALWREENGYADDLSAMDEDK